MELHLEWKALWAVIDEVVLHLFVLSEIDLPEVDMTDLGPVAVNQEHEVVH